MSESKNQINRVYTNTNRKTILRKMWLQKILDVTKPLGLFMTQI